MKSVLLFAMAWMGIFSGGASSLKAAHIIGGEITYECLGYLNNDPSTNTRRYRFLFKMYRDCQAPGAGFDATPGAFPASVTIYQTGRATPLRTIYLESPKITSIQPNPGNSCVIVPKNVCVEEGIYEALINLPIISGSYHLTYQRCCRNTTITNIVNPDVSGATYTVELTPEAQQSCNNSPVFKFFPPIVLCSGSPFTVDHSGRDAEGDSLVYEFCSPFLGGGPNVDFPLSAEGVAPDPDLAPPYRPVVFVAPTYTALQPLGTNTNIRIDARTGIISGTPVQLGQFVVGVCISEYRGGRLLSMVRRDFQFNVTNCEPNVIADVQADSVTRDGRFLIRSCGATELSFPNKSVKREFINAFRWEFDLGGQTRVFTDWEPKVQFSQPGKYAGRLLLNPGTLCADTAVLEVEVIPAVKADFSVDGDTCSTAPLRFTDRSNANGRSIRSWAWDFGDGARSNQANPEHQYATPGSRQVKLVVITLEGCTDSTARAVAAFPLPAITAVSATPAKACTPANVVFSVTGLGNLSTGYRAKWDFGDGNSGNSANAAYIYRQAGAFNPVFSVSAPNGCRVEKPAPPLQIDASPTAGFTFSPDKPSARNPVVTFSDESQGATSWSWDFGGIGQSTEADPAFTFPGAGNYAVRLITGNGSGCTDTLVRNVVIEGALNAYWPNIFSPNGDGVNDIFRPEGGLIGAQDYVLSVYDRWGVLVFQTRDIAEGWDGRWSANRIEAAPGVYLYRAIFSDVNGKRQVQDGTVTLIR